MEIHFKDRKDWRSWLETNSRSSDGLWIKVYKKHTGTECIPYAEAVEEALCYGWIDGKIKRINDEYYIQWYTPRRPGSRWSKYNIDRVKKLIKEGRMTHDGMTAYEEVLKKPHLIYDNRVTGETQIPEDLMSELKRNKTAFDNFMKFPPSSRRMYIEWMKFAKRVITRQDRIKKIILFSEQNKRPGMM
jgi:uncharacterized protein YdeI (YjbR/CyaY-like superfamily)